ncbi:hypothetical protein, variant [Aphanomyces astaci]|uniref:Uncharacterized protein n=1 Tax=Aphanomyces astaci TaxID=112090 RepID=W4H751_APHAT|nr:hypothetical protein, variant [Aphanomyces astaci]ETV87712.1 hypothetical protein, variant [Aphanomyces astaci]|eukprot:XP_009822575.1 hypothetical protein, variant [Aphanomyces astaci]
MDVAMCVLTTDTGHVLLNYAAQDTSISASHLGSLVATLQQFSHGQSMSLLQLDTYHIVVVSSPLIPVLCCLVSTTSENLAAVKLVGSYILHECLQQHRATIVSIVQQAKSDAESMAHEYTLTSALRGQSSTDTHDDLGGFQASCIAPCVMNSLNHKLGRSLTDAKLSPAIAAVWVGHVDSIDMAFQWHQVPPNTLAPWILLPCLTFHRFLHALADPTQRSLTLQLPHEPLSARAL